MDPFKGTLNPCRVLASRSQKAPSSRAAPGGGPRCAGRASFPAFWGLGSEGLGF